MLTALAILTVGASTGAREIIECPRSKPKGKPQPIYTVEQFELVWCWPDLPDAPLYRVETRTNDDPWVEEAVVDANHIALRRDLGDSVELRIRACWGSSCSDYSETSQQAWVLPNFDENGDGKIGGPDFAKMLERGDITGPAFGQLSKVFGRKIVGKRYK